MPMTDAPYRRFAQERSHNDAKSHAEYGKALSQVIIGINGVAATALITLAGASKENVLIYTKYFAVPLASYLLGVASGAVVTVFYHISAHHWATKWEQSAYGNTAKTDKEAELGKRNRDRGMICVVLSLAFFIFGGLAAGYALWFGPKPG